MWLPLASVRALSQEASGRMDRCRTQQVVVAVMNLEVSKVLKHLHYPLDVMLTCERWYA